MGVAVRQTRDRAMKDAPSVAEVMKAAGEAVPMSGDVNEDAKRLEAFLRGAAWEFNRIKAAR